MHELKMFAFEEKEIRTVIMNDEAWFVAADIASALDYRSASDMTRNLDDDEKGTQIVHTLGGNQKLSVINESGLYAAILKSRKPEAKRFKNWVTSEVLPSIRKTGSYQVQQKPQSSLDVLQGMIDSLRDQEERMGKLESKVDAISKGEAFFSVVGYANLRKARLDQAKTSAIGKMATKLCKREGIETGSAPHPLYGEVNTYPVEILDLAFDLS